MFEIQPVEAALLILWVAGVAAAVVSRALRRSRGGVGLLLVAILVPGLGSVFAILVAAWDLWSGRGSLREH